MNHFYSFFHVLSWEKCRSGNGAPLRSHPGTGAAFPLGSKKKRTGPQWLPGLVCQSPCISKSYYSSENITIVVTLALSPHQQLSLHFWHIYLSLNCQHPRGESLDTWVRHRLVCHSDFFCLLQDPHVPIFLLC